MYALIMAGGSGTRLWPKSRKNSPKQLHPFVGDKTLIQNTVSRIKDIISEKDIFIITNKSYVHKIKAQLPAVPIENILAEPFALGTAAAIAIGTKKIQSIDPNSEILMLWADQSIEDEELFRKIVIKSANASKNYDGIIIGVKPTFPSTEFGYIKIGNIKEDLGDEKIYKLDKFVEKPDSTTAQKFFDSWEYLWNTGISIWNTTKLVETFKKYTPEIWTKVEKLEKFLDHDKITGAIENIFKGIEPIPIDYAIYERSNNLAVVPADLGWSDVGTWSVLKDILTPNNESNVVKGKHIGIETENSLIYSGERLIATVGVKDLIIVDTEDVVFIADKSKAHKVKQMIEKLKAENKTEYL